MEGQPLASSLNRSVDYGWPLLSFAQCGEQLFFAVMSNDLFRPCQRSLGCRCRSGSKIGPPFVVKDKPVSYVRLICGSREQ